MSLLNEVTELVRLPTRQEEDMTVDMDDGRGFATPQFDFDPTSLAAYPGDFWKRLDSRKCCRNDESMTKVELIDVDALNNGQSGS